jgi:pimeloyl-ACP methyl ester carboxylesterase
MLPLARLLHAAGFGVFLYDARGHGASGADGPITGSKFAEDMLAAVDYLAQRAEVDMARLGVVGHSLGASGAILAASTEPRIRVLVSSSAFADPVAVVSDFLRAYHLPLWPFLGLVSYFINRWLKTNMTDAAPQNRIGQIQAPLLLIHGDSDLYIAPSNLEVLYARAQPGNAQRWLVPGRRHLNVIRDPDYGPRVINFLTEHLRG